jgi:hypothetical protein
MPHIRAYSMPENVTVIGTSITCFAGEPFEKISHLHCNMKSFGCQTLAAEFGQTKGTEVPLQTKENFKTELLFGNLTIGQSIRNGHR